MIKLIPRLYEIPYRSGIPCILSGGVRLRRTGKEFIGGELTGLSGRVIDTGSHNLKIELTTLEMGLILNIDPNNLIKVGARK